MSTTPPVLLIIHGCPTEHHKDIDKALREITQPKPTIISFTHPAPGVTQAIWVEAQDSFYPGTVYAERLTHQIATCIARWSTEPVHVAITNLHPTEHYLKVRGVVEYMQRLGELR